MTYEYEWPGHTCATTDTVTLVWDDGAKTVITAPRVGNSASCKTALVGAVPSNASPGAHFPTASVQTRDSSGARASSAFTVVAPPTATPTSTTTPGVADVLPLTPTSGGTSGPGGMAVAAVVVVLLVAVAVGATALLRRRRERLRGQDPFEFLR